MEHADGGARQKWSTPEDGARQSREHTRRWSKPEVENQGPSELGSD